jgi:DNA-binding MarR family transcriptional regulator
MSSQVFTSQASRALDAWARLLRAHSAATRTLSADLVAEHGLTINDYEALMLLARAEGNLLRRVDLAGGLMLTPSGVTRLLDGLEQAGYVDKAMCKTDARVTYAVLTASGREKLEQASRSHVAATRALFEERFDDDELAQLAELLGRLPGAAGVDGAECTLSERE